MRRNLIVLLAILSLFPITASRRSVAADVPTVTVMQAGADEFQSDIEFLMKLAGKEGEQQWPTVQGILGVFLGGVDGQRPMRIDLIFGKDPDTRLSVPIAAGQQEAFQQNVGGFIGASARRMGGGLFLYKPKPPALQYFVRELGASRSPDWGVIAEDKGNLPANFQVLAAIQPLVNAGFDLAATVENSDDEKSVNDRRQVILDLEKEVTATLQPLDGETDNEFEMRKVGLGHQFRELERIYADSQQLTLGWTTDQEKMEGRLDLELTALAETDLAKSISQLAVNPSRFAAIEKAEESIFFGRINHALDEMRQKHLGEMFELMEQDAKERLVGSQDFSDEQKAGVTTAIEKGFEMLRAGTTMGVIDGFIDVSRKDGKKGVVGAIRVADGSVAVDVLKGLKAAGWDVEIGEAAAKDADAKDADAKDADAKDADAKDADAKDADAKDADAKDADAKDADAKDADAKDADAKDADAKDADAEPTVTYHTVVLSEKFAAPVVSLFGSARFVVGTTPDAVYYAAGEGAEDRIKAAVAGGSKAVEENDGMFLEAWYRVGPILDVLRERRERQDAGQDLSKLTAEEKTERKERQEMRERAEKAFADGFDTIHTRLQRKDEKVVGQTTFAIDILRFVGMEITNVAKTKLQ